VRIKYYVGFVQTAQVKRRRGVRATWTIVPAIVATAMVATGLLLTMPSAEARPPDTNQVIRDGQVVEITDPTVTIQEWAGIFTYRLTPTGWQRLRANQIRVGDRVQFHAYSVWEIAYSFTKLRAGQPPSL